MTYNTHKIQKYKNSLNQLQNANEEKGNRLFVNVLKINTTVAFLSTPNKRSLEITMALTIAAVNSWLCEVYVYDYIYYAYLYNYY